MDEPSDNDKLSLEKSFEVAMRASMEADDEMAQLGSVAKWDNT